MDAAFFSEIEILPRLRTMRNSLFGAANVEPGSVSERENLREPSCPRPSQAACVNRFRGPTGKFPRHQEKSSPVLLDLR